MMERTSKKGFTIVELLTVMGVIAVLIGLMVPALALVKDYSKRIQQKAQFHGIDMGLQMYKTEFGSYPESNDNVDFYDPLKNHPDNPVEYCGANKLAEALVGLDMIGFHPNSDFRSDGQNEVPDPLGGAQLVNVYDASAPTGGTWQSGQENIDARKGPFVDLEHANAFRMDEVYSNYGAFQPDSLILCDVYATKRSGIGSRKTGTPILYFRARSNFSQQESTPADDLQNIGIENDVYYLPDNYNLLAQPLLDDENADYTLMNVLLTPDPYDGFEQMILNENVQTVNRPYRADSLILISAGKDGDFGTADDVFNFDKEVTE